MLLSMAPGPPTRRTSGSYFTSRAALNLPVICPLFPRNVIYNVYMFQPQRLVPVEQAEQQQQGANGSANGAAADAKAPKEPANARA